MKKEGSLRSHNVYKYVLTVFPAHLGILKPYEPPVGYMKQVFHYWKLLWTWRKRTSAGRLRLGVVVNEERKDEESDNSKCHFVHPSNETKEKAERPSEGLVRKIEVW